MAICSEKTATCDVCGCYLTQLSPSILTKIRSTEVLSCSNCSKVFYSIPACDGEIKKVWKDGKLFDYVCQKCGKSYGENYLTREKFLEGLVGV